MRKSSGVILTFIVAGALVGLTEVFAIQTFPEEGVYTGLHRSWEFEWKVRKFQRWTIDHRDMVTDIVFIGDSKIYSGINPEIFDRAFKGVSGKEVRSFNLAADGMYARSLFRVAAPLLLDSIKPHLVVMGVSPLTLRKRDPSVNSYLQAPAAKKWNPEAFLLRHSWTFSARKELSREILYGWYDRSEWKPRPSPERVSGLGFKAMDPDPNHEEVKGIRRFFGGETYAEWNVAAKPDHEYFGEGEVRVLNDLIALFQRENIPLILLVTPEVLYPYDYNLRERKLFLARMKDFEKQGIPILF